MSRVQAVIAFNKSKSRLYDKTLSQGQYIAAVAESDAAYLDLLRAAYEDSQYREVKV
jgi:hypothetical protein